VFSILVFALSVAIFFSLIQEFPASLQVDTLIQCNRPTEQMRRFMEEHERSKKKVRKVASTSKPGR
jgi:hypothetical protein